MDDAERIREFYARCEARDAAGVASLFVAGGTFRDPTTERALPATDVGRLLESVHGTLPSARFETKPLAVSNGRCVVEWTLRWEQDRERSLAGVDVFELGAAGIRRLVRYFDQRAFAEARGLQVIVEPYTHDQATFGYSMHVSSGPSRIPGIIALTWIMGRDEAERDRIRGHSRRIIAEFQQEPGFVGIVTGFAGERGFTVTAWDDEAALKRALGRHHADARRTFFGEAISPGVWTSVWKPIRTNRIWSRCPACQEANDVTSDERRQCVRCQAELPPRPPVW